MQRTASAVWNGSLKNGFGRLASQSKLLADTPYTFASRFESGAATNPEELIAAAHAGCFTMMTTALLGAAGFTADKLETKASLTLDQVAGAWTITAIALELHAIVPGLSAEQFAKIAGDAKAQCPVSKVLNATITLDAKLG
jgi:osmotically inducible protein OsmC